MQKTTPNSDHISDHDLLKQYMHSGDMESLGQLFNRHMHLIYGLCLKYLKSREESQDAVMSIFESISHKLKDQEVAYFKSWIYIVTKNHCLMVLRKEKGETIYNGAFMENELQMHHKDEKDIDDDLDALEDCIEQLKVKQKECVSLFYLKQKSYDEITQETAHSLKEVKSHIQNGKRNLKICLESKHVEK